jgi:tetratricopeptide (TPR) repeat protein
MKHRRYAVLIWAISLLFPALSWANEPAYQRGEYTQALEGFLKQVEQPNIAQGPLYYNIGNTYYKQGDYAKAYWAYRKAERHLPRDNDLYHNRILTETQLGFSPVKDSGLVLWAKRFPFLSTAEYSLATCLSLTVFSALLWIGLRFRLYKGALVVSGIVTLCFGMGTCYRYYQDHIRHDGVVITTSAIKAGPVKTLPTLTTLPAGTPCQRLRQDKGWVEVRISDTLSGWILEGDYWAL